MTRIRICSAAEIEFTDTLRWYAERSPDCRSPLRALTTGLGRSNHKGHVGHEDGVRRALESRDRLCVSRFKGNDLMETQSHREERKRQRGAGRLRVSVPP